jgi:hypothetical protein
VIPGLAIDTVSAELRAGALYVRFDVLQSLNRRKLATGEFRSNDFRVANAVPRLNLD